MRRILIANRGEIACRIARTCAGMGIEAVMAYADGDTFHSSHGSDAIAIGPGYLDISRIVQAALSSKADAVHPGYGFLSENADFAQACLDAGLIFIGPPPDVIRALSSKESGRRLAVEAGVPVVPDDAGFPLIIKASAGGGGRGMRVVRCVDELSAAMEAASREAERAFKDGSLIAERYIENARHVEVQIFGDRYGNVIHLFERDCSIQRRHQKIIEECPAPGLGDDLRTSLHEAAVSIGRHAGYRNSGTVEFLVAPNGDFFFIEVNTRIQVEHPVTEEATGLDLVRLQIEVAQGRSLAELSVAQERHAIEARLCFEDPCKGFLPSTGRYRVFGRASQDRKFQGRMDIGIPESGTVDTRYDSMFAKCIGSGGSREEARLRLLRCLRSMRVLGAATNRAYLIQLLESDVFVRGEATTEFLPEPMPPSEAGLDRAARAVSRYVQDEELSRRPILARVGAFRNNPSTDPALKLTWNGRVVNAPWTAWNSGPDPGLEVCAFENQYAAGDIVFERVDRHPKPASAGARETASSPMPGQVLRVIAEAGQSVKPGDALVVLEAMKMEQTIRSQMHGVVRTILVKPGDNVAPGQTLVHIDPLLIERGE